LLQQLTRGKCAPIGLVTEHIGNVLLGDIKAVCLNMACLKTHERCPDTALPPGVRRRLRPAGHPLISFWATPLVWPLAQLRILIDLEHRSNFIVNTILKVPAKVFTMGLETVFTIIRITVHHY